MWYVDERIMIQMRLDCDIIKSGIQAVASSNGGSKSLSSQHGAGE